MNFSGAGVVPAGEYDEEISIAGSGHIKGNIKCTEFHSAGSTKSDGDIECTGLIKTAGAFTTKGSVKSSEKISFSGSATVYGRIKCEELSTAGAFHTNDGIEAETATIRGMINCGGLLNAEKIDINFGGGCHVDSIGGGKITIRLGNGVIVNHISDLPLFSKLMGKKCGADVFRVDEYIEGDTIAIEYVNAPVVTGRIVAVGAGCEIDVVRYSEQIEVSPDAKVGHIEKEE